MLTIQTPNRASLLGGGLDYEEYVEKYGGVVIGGAIRQYSYFCVRHLPHFFPFKSRLAYSRVETVKEHTEVEHRAIRAVLEEIGWDGPDSPGLEITHCADLPASCGVGSSSTFVVGLLHALSTLQGKVIGPEELARRAIRVERQRMGETVGSQDQTFAAHGGFHRVEFRKTGEVSLTPLLDEVQLKDLERHLLMVYTIPRKVTASEVARTYAPHLTSMVDPQWAMKKLVEDGVRAIEKRDWEHLGKLVEQSWRIKQSLSGAICPEFVAEVSCRGMLYGAWGGKLMGAGGGGCFLFLLPPEKRQTVLDNLPAGVIEIPIRFSLEGSRVISW